MGAAISTHDTHTYCRVTWRGGSARQRAGTLARRNRTPTYAMPARGARGMCNSAYLRHPPPLPGPGAQRLAGGAGGQVAPGGGSGAPSPSTSADSIVPGNASGGMAGIAYKPLTVDVHEPGFVAKIAQENQFGPWYMLSDKEKQQLGAPWGPANPQALNRYSYVLNNPMRWTDPGGMLRKAVIVKLVIIPFVPMQKEIKGDAVDNTREKSPMRTAQRTLWLPIVSIPKDAE